MWVVQSSAMELYQLYTLDPELCCWQEIFCIYATRDVHRDVQSTGNNLDHV